MTFNGIVAIFRVYIGELCSQVITWEKKGKKIP